MAKLIDADGSVVAETTDVDFSDLNEETEEQPQEAEAQEAPQEEPEESPDLPEKYQGKSAADIARMHQELEKRLGQQSAEVGELRKAFDEMIQSKAVSSTPTPEVEEVDDVDFFADPKAAVQRAIENHPTLKQAQAVAAEMQKSQSLAKLQAAHPDMKEVLSDSKFQEWVRGSEFRKNLFAQADQRYDFDAANELLTLYKDTRGVVQQQAAVEKVAQKNELKKASTGSSRSNPDGQKSRKIYRRRDIIELMNKDPKRYEALQPEIMKAYQEGRVK
jgi:hypothetical protein